MEPAHLEDRAIIAISGPQARDFLQGLVTNDVVGGLTPGTGLYAALLSPQGKILFDFLVTEGEGAVLIDVARDSQEALLKKLRLYRLRAKIEIEARDQLGVYLDLQGHPDNRPTRYADRAITFRDPRLAALGSRSIGAKAEMPVELRLSGEYHAARLALGVPEGADFGSEKVFALDAGLSELNGVSFTKGCYVGQELTSRMKHRATSRKRILPIAADTALPQIGTAVAAGAVEVGEIVSTYGANGFALVRLDRLDETPGPVTAGGLAVALTRPAWLGNA